MPSKDRIDPKLNAWMESSGQERLSEIVSAEHGRRGSRTERREMAGQIQRLAKRLGSDPDEFARKIPEDTVRRLKYGVIEDVDENGRRTFRHDLGIVEGRRSLIKP